MGRLETQMNRTINDYVLVEIMEEIKEEAPKFIVEKKQSPLIKGVVLLDSENITKDTTIFFFKRDANEIEDGKCLIKFTNIVGVL